MYQFIHKWFNINATEECHKKKAAKARGSLRQLRLETLEDRRMLATLTVSVDHDNVDAFGGPIINDGDLTLRDAIAYVNRDFNPGPNDLVHIDLTEPFGTNDTILFDSSSLDGQTITLGIDDMGNSLNLGINGDLDITEAVTIDAEGSDITIDASGNDLTPNSTLDDGDSTNDGDGSNVFSISLFGAPVKSSSL